MLFNKWPVLLTRLIPEDKPELSGKKNFIMASGTVYTRFERESKLPAKSKVLLSSNPCSTQCVSYHLACKVFVLLLPPNGLLPEILRSLLKGGVQEISDEWSSLNVCAPPKFICWNPNLQCGGIWRRPLGKWLGHEDRAMWGQNEKRAFTPPSQHPDLKLPASRTWGINFCCLWYPVRGVSLQRPEWTKTMSEWIDYVSN